ncbi:MAG: ATP-binding protein [Chloroflexi bacterium]|nr:ATP-binding protein [Chloroflexota bacterium]
MKSIGEVIGPIEARIAARRTTISSNAEDGGGDPPRLPEGGDGRPDCPRCGGLGWLRRELPIGHPEFGRALACDCIAEELAERRMASARRASNMGSLDRMTFESFKVRAAGNAPEAMSSLEQALGLARDFAERPEGWLLLTGSYGCGKTHLAAAIVNQRVAAGGGALFVVVPDLLDHLRAAYAPGAAEGYDARFEAVRDAPLLALDDLGTESPTPWAAEKLFQILNHRYNARLATVITTNHALEDLDERLRSRLSELGFARHCHISALDYRGGIHNDGTALSSLALYDEARFQTWDARTGELEREQAENLAKAFHLARGFAEEPRGWLAFVGEHGCGKTHLAAAIANQRVTDGGSALFVTVPDLLDHLRATFSPTSRVRYDKRFEEVRQASLLVLDDLGTESATPWAQEKLFQILNHRHAAQLPTVLTIGAPDARDPLREVQPRLRSRLLDRRRCTVFHILAPSYLGPAARPRRGRR